MKKIYFTLCEDFRQMAETFYGEYLMSKQKYENQAQGNGLLDDIIPAKGMQMAASAAVVFEAIAIEAYVNLLGSYLVPDSYYVNYESKTAKIKDRSTLGKLKSLCKEEIKKSYPADHALEVMQDLFTKRDRIVHTKPVAHSFEIKPFNYNNIGSNYADYTSAFSEEIGFLYDGLEEQMQSYPTLIQNINALLGKDMLEEIRSAPMQNISLALGDMFTHIFKKDTPES